jgi:nucleotide-binding universal stress UspA family protein
MTFGTVIVGRAEREGDDDAMSLANQLVDPERAVVLPVHVEAPHRWGGSPADALAEAVARHAAELVVVGSGRRALPGRPAPTRTAMHLLEHAACPVAVAPRGYRAAGAFRHIGVAYDGTPEADTALQAAYALAARDRAAVTLYLTMLDGRVGYAGLETSQYDMAAQRARVEAQDTLDAAADRAPANVNPETVLLHGDPAADIAAAANGIVDLLVTGSRGVGAVRRAVGMSVSEKLLLVATAPVLLVPLAPVA